MDFEREFNRFKRTPADARQDTIFWKQIQPKIIKNFDDCWYWSGYTCKKGYGTVRIGGRSGKTIKIHRWMYEYVLGKIPDGLHIDHICCHRNCCNPIHLEPVTPTENTRRGEGMGMVNAAKQQCPKGHRYTLENTRYDHGRRRCRMCLRAARKQKRMTKNA